MTTTTDPIEVRRGANRGRTKLRWLDARHSFSFGRYSDPHRMSYRMLRVLNEDVVAPDTGFGEHAHDNMEIISWMLGGAIAHADSEGHAGVIRPGDAQVMTAGSGIRHSEMNPSKTESAHMLQIWIDPAKRDLTPSYEQRHFDEKNRQGAWQVIASPDGRGESLRIHQDAVVSVIDLQRGDSVEVNVQSHRFAYLHLATGAARWNRVNLESGDALSIPGGEALELTATADAQALLFDLA